MKDIFISYKTGGTGSSFSSKLKRKLDDLGYSVYFNPHEERSKDFREKLKKAVLECTDFIIVLNQKCLEQLSKNNIDDYIRFEILIAKENGKNIIPIYLDNINIAEWYGKLPEELDFILYVDGITVYDEDYYDVSPFDRIRKEIKSFPEKEDLYRDTYNSNFEYDIVQDFNKTLVKAKSGDPKAMYEIANMYFYGFADENGQSNRNFAEAYKWFKFLSDSENEYTARANSMIAKMHYRGIVPREEQSYEKSLDYHKKAASQSGYSAQQLAFMLSIGAGCDFDFDIAEKEYLKAIEHGDNIAYVKLADMYVGLGKMRAAANLYEKIKDVFPDAEYKLGCMYKRGVLSDPPKPDYFRAAVHFHHVISHGGCGANVYHELGQLYFCPTGGFIKDFKTAQANFLIAADMGHIDAQYQVAYMYEHGHVERNISKAIYYHTLAADQGHFLSPTHLAQIYQLSECKNYHKAFRYAQKAAEIGEKEGEFILANLLFFGRGCEPNVNKAYEMYSRAFEHGVDQAKFMMEKIEREN